MSGWPLDKLERLVESTVRKPGQKRDHPVKATVAQVLAARKLIRAMKGDAEGGRRHDAVIEYSHGRPTLSDSVTAPRVEIFIDIPRTADSPAATVIDAPAPAAIEAQPSAPASDPACEI